MRLPWPFGRSEAAPADPEHDGRAAVSPRPADARAADRRVVVACPPIQRVGGEPPVVAPAGSFLADVPGARPLPPIVGQLGHDVTPLAPSGLVAAPPRGRVADVARGALGRPVQRHLSGPDAGAGAWTTSSISESSALPAARDAGTEGQLVERASAPPPDRSQGDARARAVAPERRDIRDRERPDSAAHASAGDARPGRAADRGGGHAVHHALARRRAGTRDAGLGGDPGDAGWVDRPPLGGASDGHRERCLVPPGGPSAPRPRLADARGAGQRGRVAPDAPAGGRGARDRRRRHPRVRKPRLLGLGARRPRPWRTRCRRLRAGASGHRAPSLRPTRRPARRSRGSPTCPASRSRPAPRARRPTPNRSATTTPIRGRRRTHARRPLASSG